MSAAAGQEESVEVVCIDPRTVLAGQQASDWQALLDDARAALRFSLPAAFLPRLSSEGKLELGDADDPACSWHWAARAELFEYRCLGMVPTMSGFAAFVRASELQALADGRAPPAELPAWEAFKARLQAGEVAFPAGPFLFAGTVLDSPAAAVYALRRGGQLAGLAVSSEGAEG